MLDLKNFFFLMIGCGLCAPGVGGVSRKKISVMVGAHEEPDCCLKIGSIKCNEKEGWFTGDMLEKGKMIYGREMRKAEETFKRLLGEDDLSPYHLELFDSLQFGNNISWELWDHKNKQILEPKERRIENVESMYVRSKSFSKIEVEFSLTRLAKTAAEVPFTLAGCTKLRTVVPTSKRPLKAAIADELGCSPDDIKNTSFDLSDDDFSVDSNEVERYNGMIVDLCGAFAAESEEKYGQWDTFAKESARRVEQRIPDRAIERCAKIMDRRPMCVEGKNLDIPYKILVLLAGKWCDMHHIIKEELGIKRGDGQVTAASRRKDTDSITKFFYEAVLCREFTTDNARSFIQKIQALAPNACEEFGKKRGDDIASVYGIEQLCIKRGFTDNGRLELRDMLREVLEEEVKIYESRFALTIDILPKPNATDSEVAEEPGVAEEVDGEEVAVEEKR